MNEKRAKSKLLKGAKKTNHLDVEMKTGCENMRFSDRSYFKVLLPFLKDWHNKVKKPFKFDDLEILVDESDAGMDNANRHMDTKMVVFANTERIVLHAYNGTQNLMVQGKNF